MNVGLTALRSDELSGWLSAAVMAPDEAILPALADAIRQQVAGTYRTERGISRRRLLYSIGQFLAALGPFCELPDVDPASLIADLELVGDLTSDTDTVFPTPIRAVELPATDTFLLAGSSSTVLFDLNIRKEIRASGYGRVISRAGWEQTGVSRIETFESWIGATRPRDLLAWADSLERDHAARWQRLALQIEPLEFLAVQPGRNPVAWVAAAKPSRTSSPLLSKRGYGLLRVKTGKRVLTTYLSKGSSLSESPAEYSLVNLTPSEALRFELYLRRLTAHPARAVWLDMEATRSDLVPLRIFWGNVPWDEAKLRRLGEDVVFEDSGRHHSGFLRVLVQPISSVLTSAGFEVVGNVS